MSIQEQQSKQQPFKTADDEAHDRLLQDQQARQMPVPEPAQNPAYPILAYCGASITMTLVNKFVVSGANFDMNFLLLTIQSAVCVGAVYAARALGVFTFRDFNVPDAKAWFPVSALLVAVIYSGSKSLQNLPIPAYTVLKNGAIILTAYGELVVFKSPLSRLTLVAFGLMVVSSLIAAWPELSKTLAGTGSISDEEKSTLVGYVWMTLNCFATAGYLLYMRGRIKLLGFKDLDSMLFNNLLSIPILVVASILFEDWGSESLARNFPQEGRYFLLFAMAFSGAATVGISYTTAWCIRVTSSTTYSMVGALNKLPVAASGFLFFGDPATFSSVGSVLVGFLAGLVYSSAKSQQASEARAKAAGEIPMHSVRDQKA